jgi:6-pyruvoyltetrahydropterin/6-carboxytetrahydropterin synthase
MYELTKSFRFEAAHHLSGTTLGAGSEEIHGHSFRAEITVRGTPDAATGMVVDLGVLDRQMADIRALLDHKLLNNVKELGAPTLENLTRFIWDRVQASGHVTKVSVHRDSCNESCAYFGPAQQ